MGYDAIEKLGGSLLSDLQFEMGEKETSFIFCFWVYLPNSTAFPSTILHQMDSEKPFLSLSEDKRLILLPFAMLQKESSDSRENESSEEVPCAISNVELPLGRWTHVGCQVCSNSLCIYLNGDVVGERPLDSSMVKRAESQSSAKVILSAICKGLKGFAGYVHNAAVLPTTSSIKDHHVKDPPLWLCIDGSSVSNIEVENGGIWKIIGGKESSREMFSLDVLLLNAFGELVDKEVEVVASLTYADNHSPVEKSKDDEAPLLTTCNGLDFPSDDKPRKLLQGRATFHLNISLLSSECDKKLFCVKFVVLNMGDSPFLEAFTPPIQCILRKCDTKISTIKWKKLPSGVHLFSGSSLPQFGAGNSELPQKAVYEAVPSPLKKKKLGHGSPLPVTKAESYAQSPDEECNSNSAATKVQNTVGTSLESIQQNYGGIDNSASDSESVGARTSELKNIPCNRELNSDLTIFRYCLGGLSERSLMLKEISSYASEKEIEEMAEKVSFFTGCSHHRYQIMIAKKLLEEGERAWKLISQNSHRVQWDNVVFEIEEQFMRIAGCSTRSLTQQHLPYQDMGSMICGHLCLLSGSRVFFTKEEVEYALQSPLGIQEPGTFILRFPTTRSWPHPDAGSLVVSYVSRDFSLRHRQLSLDYSSGIFDTFDPNQKPLQELLLSEPELSRVGRIAGVI